MANRIDTITCISLEFDGTHVPTLIGASVSGLRSDASTPAQIHTPGAQIRWGRGNQSICATIIQAAQSLMQCHGPCPDEPILTGSRPSLATKYLETVTGSAPGWLLEMFGETSDGTSSLSGFLKPKVTGGNHTVTVCYRAKIEIHISGTPLTTPQQISGIYTGLLRLLGEKPPASKPAWELFVELATRVTTQPLPDAAGSESAALASIHSIFSIVREILKKHGPDGDEFHAAAFAMLNQTIRPFTTRWHPVDEDGCLSSPEQKAEFRQELVSLQRSLRDHTEQFATLAGVTPASIPTLKL